MKSRLPILPVSSVRVLRAVHAVLFCAALGAVAAPPDWPAWRGADFKGRVLTGEFPTQWTADQARWKVALPGKGSSSPIIWQERIYLTTPADGQDAVMALDMSGKVLWQTKLGPASPPRHRTLGSSANASPVTDGTGIYVYFRSGRLAALDLDGKVRWTVNITERFGAEELFWDQGTSPVVTRRDVVLARMHGGESWLAGFDKQTGEMRWRELRNYRVPSENDNGYTTPLIFEHEGKEALLLWGADHLTAHDAADGRPLWSVGGFNPDRTGFWPAIATPVIHKDIVVVPVGRDDRARQARMHGIRLGGSGDVTETHRVWQRDDVGVFTATPVEYQGKIYLLRHRGEIVCLDPATGKTLWTGELPRGSASYYASPLIANGILYAVREDGVVFTARVGDKFEFLSENPMGERIIASPVPVGNGILLRGDNHLFLVGGS